MGRKRYQVDQKADLRGGKFIGLPTVIYKHEAYKRLPAFERALLLELIAVFNGYNNGQIVLSQRQMAERLGTTNYRRISRAIARLIEHGLLDISADSVWKQRRAREYRLTFIGTGKHPHTKSASNDYLNWKYECVETSAETPTTAEPLSADRNSLAEPVSAESAEKRQKCVEGECFPAEPVSSLISKPYVAPLKGGNSIPTNTPDPALSELADLRGLALARIDIGGAGEQSRIAERTGIPGGTLSKFLHGRSLPPEYRERLLSAVS